MYNYGEVTSGVAKYIDEEILSKVSDWRNWVIGAGLGVAMSNSTSVFNELKNNSMIKLLGVVDKNDMIDVDTLYKEMKKQAEKNSITFEVPMLGMMTLNSTDVDKIYEAIKSQR